MPLLIFNNIFFNFQSSYNFYTRKFTRHDSFRYLHLGLMYPFISSGYKQRAPATSANHFFLFNTAVKTVVGQCNNRSDLLDKSNLETISHPSENEILQLDNFLAINSNRVATFPATSPVEI